MIAGGDFTCDCTSKLKLIEQAEETEVSGAESAEVRSQDLESKPQRAVFQSLSLEEGMIPAATAVSH